MKIFFFLVVLANVTLFLWEYKKGVYQHIDKQYEAVAPAEREAILLEGELKKDRKNEIINYEESQNSPAENPESAIDTASVNNQNQENSSNLNEQEITGLTQTGEKKSTHCYQAGPFASGDLDDIWRSRLSPSGAQIKFISREEKIINDYAVYYPAEETVEAFEANLQRIKKIGLKTVLD